MSQINDALKRAQDIQTKGFPSSVPPMLPAESRVGLPAANWIWPVAILLLLLLFAGLFIAVSSGRHAATKIATEPAPVPVVKSTPAPNPAPVAPATEVLTANISKPVQIQGIVSDPVHPYAIISGKTVFVGDAVNGQRVTAISPDTLTLVGNGQTNRLRFGVR
jgi:hypothetical protein